MLDKMLKHFYVFIWWNFQMNLVETFPKSFERLVLVKRIPQKICIHYLSLETLSHKEDLPYEISKLFLLFKIAPFSSIFPTFHMFFNLSPKKHIKMLTPIQTLLYKTLKVKLISPPKWVVRLVSMRFSLLHKTLFVHFGIYVLFQLHWTISHLSNDPLSNKFNL